MDVLMIDKNVLKESSTRSRICPDISPKLLLNFLMLFKPDECDKPRIYCSLPFNHSCNFCCDPRYPTTFSHSMSDLSFFPEPIDPGLLQMIDAEASRHDGASRSPSGDSLQEVLFKDPPVRPPPVAVNMYVSPFLPLSSNAILLFLQERSGRVRPCCARVLRSAS